MTNEETSQHLRPRFSILRFALKTSATARERLSAGRLRTAVAVLVVGGAILTLAACKGASSATPPPISGTPPTVDGERALQQVAAQVALGQRQSGTPAAKLAAEQIRDQALALGYTDVRIDEWQEDTPLGPTTFRNVHVVLPGKGDKFIILGSHYDTKRLGGATQFVGANDAGSSTGLSLELMRALKVGEPWQGLPVHFIFFDGEEAYVAYTKDDGLRGSRKVAGDLATAGDIGKCRAMVLLDMVGDAKLNITLPPNSDTDLAKRLLAISERQGTRSHFGFYLFGSITDDHTSFQKQGVPAIDLIDFDYGPGNSYWHTDRDTLDKISSESLKIVGDAVAALLWELR